MYFYTDCMVVTVDLTQPAAWQRGGVQCQTKQILQI